MMRRNLLLLAGAVALGVAAAFATGSAEADPSGLCPTAAGAAIQLAQTEGEPILTCCFEDGTSDACSITSPNQMGCEWTLLYQCKDGKYTCSTETKTCACDEPGGGVTSTP
jgi:hypothetical protein